MSVTDHQNLAQSVQPLLVCVSVSSDIWRLQSESAYGFRVEACHVTWSEQRQQVFDKAVLDCKVGDVLRECVQSNLGMVSKKKLPSGAETTYFVVR